MAGFRALLGPGTDPSTYYAGFGESVTDTRRPGYLSGIWIGVPPLPPSPLPVSRYGGTGLPVRKA